MQNCQGCKWFQAKGKNMIGRPYGECRKLAPRIWQVAGTNENGHQEARAGEGWPEVEAADFCGQFEAK